MVFSSEKFWSYIIRTKVIVHPDQVALRYIMSNKDAQLRLIRWALLLQEFNFEVKDQKGTKNQVTDHLSRIEKEAMQ